MSRKGQVKFAKEGIHCAECGIWLAPGVRKANQFLCTLTKEERENGANRSQCQKEYYNKLKRNGGGDDRIERFIICDQCGKKIKPMSPCQKRCPSSIEGVLTDCQKTAQSKNYKDINSAATEKSLEKKRVCLKCGKKFKSVSPYNRVCERCSAINNRVCERGCHKTGNSPNSSRRMIDSGLVESIL